MIDTIFRVAAILMMFGVICGAGRIAWWLGAVWFQRHDVVPLWIQPLDVSHGDKVEKEEGKHLAALLVRQIQRIQGIMSADLSDLGDANQVRIESVVPKNLHLAPDVSVKMDIEVKAFNVDVVGMFEKLYKFFDRSDRLQVAMWISETVKLFAALKTEDKQRSIGPWWLEKLDNVQAAVEKFAHVYALDLYRTQVRGFDELDAASFATFVEGLNIYQEYIRKRHANPQVTYTETLERAGDLFQKIANNGEASALVYSYLGSVRSLQNQADEAIAAYARATALNPSDIFAAHALKRLQEAKALQPVPVAAPQAGPTLEALRTQKLPGYDAAALPPARRDIAIAVIGTGISPQLSRAIGQRLVHSSSTVPGEPDTDDQSGHGTAVTALAAALAPSAQIISIKSLSQTGTAAGAVIAEGIRSAIREKATVILLPLGSPQPVKEIEDAVGEALKAGVLVVAAAGNDGTAQATFPARLSGVTAVGSVDASDQLARFSNWGPDLLYAPGVNIQVLGTDGKLVSQSGTSFSATVAAAIAAVVWAAKPDLSAQQIHALLIATSADLGPIDPTNLQLGRLRRVDAIAALQN